MTRSKGRALVKVSRRTNRVLGPTGLTVRNRIVGTVRSIDKNEEKVVAEVRAAISGGARAGGALVADTASLIEEVVRGALAATLEAGVGMLVVVKAVAKGVVLGVSDVGGDVASAAVSTARSVVEAAAKAGANVPAVAWRAVVGLVEGAMEVGANVGQIAAAAARGALEGAACAGRQASDLVLSGFATVTQSVAQVFEPTGKTAPVAKSTGRRKGAMARSRKRASPRARVARKDAKSRTTPASGTRRLAFEAKKIKATSGAKKRAR